MNPTRIEWCRNPDGSQGYTWNPVTGCLGPEYDGMRCPYCYAQRLANGRLKPLYLANQNVSWVDAMTCKHRLDDPFYPRLWEDRFGQIPLSGKSLGIFVCDMSDLFDIGVPIQWTHRVLDDIGERSRHRFYLLTKQPQHLGLFSPFPSNCYVGITIDGTDRTSFSGFVNIQARIKYVSFEPLLGSVADQLHLLRNAGIGWVIIGGQSGPDRFYPPEDWIQEIEDACGEYGIPVFEKNNLRPSGSLRQEMVEVNDDYVQWHIRAYK